MTENSQVFENAEALRRRSSWRLLDQRGLGTFDDLSKKGLGTLPPMSQIVLVMGALDLSGALELEETDDDESTVDDDDEESVEAEAQRPMESRK